MRSLPRLPLAAAALLSGGCILASSTPGMAQTTPPVGREAATSLRFRELGFDPPRVEKHELEQGVPVFLMEDRTLPLVTVYVRFKGGYALLPRGSYAAASALPGLLRSGGTTSFPPDSVNSLVDYFALQLTFGGGGQSTFSSVNTLTKHLPDALALWAEVLKRPRFDSLEVEVWRDRQMESIRRRADDPGLLAFSEFNRLMFGDHPIGWEMEPQDLVPERFSPLELQAVHERIFCPENMILGIVGDVGWSEVEPLLEGIVEGWPACSGPLLDPRTPEMREGGGVFLIPKELSQSTVVMAQPGGVTQGTHPDFFSSRIGNSILGASGFSSRLLSQVRTEKGYAYSASSLWTTPSQYEGIVGAVTQTKSGSTVAAVQLILEIMKEMTEVPPARDEVELAIDQIVNSFVFNFQDPAQIVSRQMYYLGQGLPEDWLQHFIRGIQGVSPEAVRQVFRDHLDPEGMLILILGNPEDFDLPPDVLGKVQIWEPRGG